MFQDENVLETDLKLTIENKVWPRWLNDKASTYKVNSGRLSQTEKKKILIPHPLHSSDLAPWNFDLLPLIPMLKIPFSVLQYSSDFIDYHRRKWFFSGRMARKLSAYITEIPLKRA